jgi:peptide deformylase
MQCGGTTARVIQHEMDHLEGVLFVDHLSKIKRDIILRRLLKVRRQKQTAVA